MALCLTMHELASILAFMETTVHVHCARAGYMNGPDLGVAAWVQCVRPGLAIIFIS